MPIETGDIDAVADITHPHDGPLDEVAADRRRRTVRGWLAGRGVAPVGAILRDDGRAVQGWDLAVVRAARSLRRPSGVAALSPAERGGAPGRGGAAGGRP